MKKATKRIMEYFPKLKNKINNSEQTNQDLMDVESIFFSLALFFEHPETQSFDLNTIYKKLDNEWLEFALELITEYFQKDTYLIKKPSFSLLKENGTYKTQSQFAEFLTDNQVPYTSAKIKMYYDRGKMPKADLVVAGHKYWLETTIQTFLEEELARKNHIY